MMRPLMFVAALLASTTMLSGASLAQSDAEVCQAMPAQIEQAASAAGETKEAKRALVLRQTGIKLCEEGNRRAAQKKFKEALNVLGQPAA
jgi:hypothetical protein